MAFKDLFIKPEEPKIQPKQSSANKTTQPGTLKESYYGKSSEDVHIASFTAPAGDSKVNDYRELLKKAIQEAHAGHPSAPDYVEFVVALSKMDGKPIDEETKFFSVFTGFEAQGVTVEKLIEAAEHYKQVVATEKEGFEASITTQSNNTIGKNKQAATELTAKNTDIDEQMKNLAEQKQANLKQIDTLNTSIQADGNKLESRKNDFESAFSSVTHEIDNNIALIKKHLQKSPA
jgi:hypothetical protein